MAAPQTERWTARENKQAKTTRLLVNGLVRVDNTGDRPRLTEAAHSGKTLVLDLTIEPGDRGTGQQVPVWMPAHYHEDCTVDAHERVDIRFEGKSIATCKVVDDGEYEMHLTALTTTANKAQSGQKGGGPAKTARKAAKKAAAKKRTAKKSTAKKSAARKTAAKKAAKKTAKKSTKKTAARKRPVKKSAVKRGGVKKRSAVKRRPARRGRR